MASTPSFNLNDPARCVIYYSVRLLDEDPEDLFNISAVKEVVQYASGDFNKVILVGIFKWGRQAVTIFDYDNSDHLDSCRVLGFKYRPAIKPFGAPTELIHSTVNTWAGENKRHNLSFPRRSQITLSPKHSCRPPPDARATDSATAGMIIASDRTTEESTIKTLVSV